MNDYLRFCNYTCLHYLNPLGKLMPFIFIAFVIVILGLLALFIIDCESEYNLFSFKWFRCLVGALVIFLVLGIFLLFTSDQSIMNLNQEGQRLEKRYINEAHQEYPYLVKINGHKYLSKTKKGRQLIELNDSKVAELKVVKFYFVGGKISFVLDSKSYLRQTMKKELRSSIDFRGLN